MGCAETKETKEEGGYGEVVDILNVPALNPNYPDPYPPETFRQDILNPKTCDEIEDRVKRMPSGTEAGYPGLLKYLAQGAEDQVGHVTAIYHWVVSQDYTSPPSPPGPPGKAKDKAKDDNDTPGAYIDMVRGGTGDIPTFFTILCRRSGIPCVMLDGLCKDSDYEVGSSEQKRGRWNAVYADKDWRLVHLGWCMQGLPDSNQNSSENQTTDRDFFFMTDPGEFATFCQPDDYMWQLLDDPYSRKEFFCLPYLTSKYYDLCGSLVRPKKGVTKTSKAAVDVEIAFPKNVFNQLTFTYKLVSKEEARDDDYIGMGDRHHSRDLQKYVFMHRTSSRLLFDIRLPRVGVYLFSVHAKMVPEDSQDHDRDVMQKLCDLRVVSNNDPEEDMEQLPETPYAGWGPGPLCRHVGLVPLSHFDGYICIKPKEVRTVRFRLQQEDVSVKSELSHDRIPSHDLEDQVKSDIVGEEVRVLVRIPEEGQYALKIYARGRDDPEYREACFYLLKQQVKQNDGEKYRDRMFRKKLEYHLTNHTSPGELTSALETFECYNVPDQGEKQRTHEKLKQYWEIKYELDHAVKRRNVPNLHKWIDRAKESKYEPDLREDIERAEHFTENMYKLKGNTHPMARMDEHTMLEVRSLKRPRPEIHRVMSSTYLLLGEERQDVDNWEYIQYQMGQPGKYSLNNRINNRRTEDASKEKVDEAEELIKPYSLQKCRDASHGTAAYYKWCHHFIQDFRRKEKEEEEEERMRAMTVDDEPFRADSRDRRNDTPNNGDGGTPPPREKTDYRTPTPRDEKHPFLIDENKQKRNRSPILPSQQDYNNRKDEPFAYSGFRE